MEKHFYKDCRITDINEKERTMVVTASDETVDRYNEIMKVAGCKYRNDGKLPFLWSHNRKEDLPPIGKSMWVKRMKGLEAVRAKIEFAPTEFADSIYNLYKGGFLTGVSIGFLPIKDREPTKEEVKKGAKRIIEEWELLEISAVPIPANPNAVAEAIKSGELQLPAMVYKDFGFEKEENIIQSNTGTPDWKDNKTEVEEWDTTLSDGLDESIEEQKEEEIEENVTEETEIELAMEEIEEKPYEGEHSCRLNSPEKYVKFNRKNCEQKHDGKCIDVIYGRKKDDKSEIQSLRYSKDIWKEAAARSHCKSREGTFEAAKKEAKTEKYKCECIKCGHKLESEKHCKDIKCPKCGGEMRRVERPGPGREFEVDMSHTLENYKLVYNESINQYYFKLKEQPEKDYIKIVKPEKPKIKVMKKSPNIGLEKLAQNEDNIKELAKVLAKELAKDVIDSWCRDFRENVLGIVDD